MTLREEIQHYIDDVPESSLQLLLQFVRFLRESPAVPAKREKRKRDRPRLLGVLEAIRTAKKAEAELQEAVV
ncbi:MAG: hypothetical protein IJG37_07445 [Synergistaceae bacterium]|nr:hypothetical protein [Synergistaceae bacterium]MBQ4431593.1 hypothetical protein [Synergistaceae bacterium]MBQ7169223.1 hypothetical protein [Synergistaceae bacterium]